ncbi:MAG: hypothetical protein KL787_05780 [Taibaiella sp.]|nr:hypothetical protein [Taibaiella sp.]
MSTTIKFGTDGWRAIIAKEYTVENVARVSKGVARWLLKKKLHPKVVIGHDCRFGGAMFVDTVVNVLCGQGIKVLKPEDFVSTPMVSFGVLDHKADQGIVITASHNPPLYNGFKLKGAHGGPASPADIAEVEELIPDNGDFESYPEQYWQDKGLLETIDLEAAYIHYLHQKFDLEKMAAAPYKLAYDAMYGAGQNVIRKILPGAVGLHCEVNPSFNGVAPEPLHKNLLALSETMAKTPELKIGLANDGDADRIALYDEDGNYVDAHHIILLLIHYLHKYKGMTGKVAIAFSTSEKVRKLCEAYGLPIEVTPIGFKYISEIMIREDVLVGGEESGGIAVKGHIPERDGIYDGLVIYDYMVQTGKTLKEMIREVYDVVGSFAYERADLTLDNAQKESIIRDAMDGKYGTFGKYNSIRTETTDGVKFHLDNGGWMMLRASGTEPLLRIYAEGKDKDEAFDILNDVKNTLGI